MSSLHATPSNAFRHAKEQIGVGRREEALHTLILGIQSRKVRVWSADHSKIMLFLNELAVEQRYNLRDVYQQFLRLCIANNMDSFLQAVQHYMKLVLARCEKARVEAEAANEAKVDKEDELEQTPEQLMLGLQLVDTERSTREILAPWVKYTVETYRAVMDVVYRNVKTVRFYHELCRSGFDFLQRYERNWDFRRLCDSIRYHQNRLKSPSGDISDKHRQKVELSDPQVQTLYLETQFRQLEAASGMELWKEAYRTIEDIHESLMNFDTEPEPELMATYYNKLADIFWASKNYLFHAYSLREFAFTRQQCEPLPDAAAQQAVITEQASAVLLATLVVPLTTRIGEQENDMLVQNDSNQQLAELLGFKKETPTRARLTAEVTQTIGFMEEVTPTVLRIYELLEQEFSPMTLATQLQPLLEEIQKTPALARYAEQLKHTAVVRIIQQCSTVYDTLQYDKFLKFLPEGMDEHQIELIILHTARDYNASVSLDWRARLLRFGGVAGSHVKVEKDGYNAGTLSTVIHSCIDDSQIFSEQLKVLGLRLRSALDRVSLQEQPAETSRAEIFAHIREGAAQDHEAVGKRQEEIQRRLHGFESRRQEKEKRDEELRRELEQQKKIDEYLRLQEESRQREAARVAREQEAAELNKKKEIVAILHEKVQDLSTKTKAAKELDNIDVANVDKEELLRLGREVIESEKAEAERSRKEAAKMHEYYVRALRVEETALMVEVLKKSREQEAEKLSEYWAVKQAELEKSHAHALKEKRRLERMGPIQKDWSESIISVRREAYEEARAAQLERLQEAREARAEEERRARAEEAERKRQEEEERLRKEEEERLREEREAEERKQREELFRRQRERELEMEERERQEREKREQERLEQEKLRSSPSRTQSPAERGPTDSSSARPWGRRAPSSTVAGDSHQAAPSRPSAGGAPSWDRREARQDVRGPSHSSLGSGGGSGWGREKQEDKAPPSASSSGGFRHRERMEDRPPRSSRMDDRPPARSPGKSWGRRGQDELPAQSFRDRRSPASAGDSRREDTRRGSPDEAPASGFRKRQSQQPPAQKAPEKSVEPEQQQKEAPAAEASPQAEEADGWIRVGGGGSRGNQNRRSGGRGFQRGEGVGSSRGGRGFNRGSSNGREARR